MLRDEFKLPFKNYNHPSVKRHDGKAGTLRRSRDSSGGEGQERRENLILISDLRNYK